MLFEKQFGFQKSTSTEHAILEVADQISRAFSDKAYTLGVFIDLSKAFDTVDHEILLNKLTFYGISGKTKKWLESYLNNRKQCVAIENGRFTSLLNITCGVPQGSILGPLLFILYVNDLPNASRKLSPILFADDTSLFCTGKSIENIFSVMNKELAHIAEWFKANKLSLNIEKTKFSLFHSARKKIHTSLPKLYMERNEITRETVTKFLGVFIDEHLSWKPHIDKISKTVSKNIGILYKARVCLQKPYLKQLYYAFIHSYLNYCNIAWGSTYKSNLSYLFRRQKHSIRVINNKNRLSHTSELFKNDFVLNLYAINIHQTLCMLFKCKTKTAPTIFHNIYTLKRKNKYTTRSGNKLIEPFSSSRMSDFRLSNRGPRIWNFFTGLHPSLLKLENLKIFKHSVKKMLLTFEEWEKFF